MKDFAEVIRCKYCKWYVSWYNMKGNPEEYPAADGYDNALGYDGFCDNCDKWTDEDDFCSHAEEKDQKNNM